MRKSSIYEQGGWEKFTVSNQQITINTKIALLLGIPFGHMFKLEKGWTSKHLHSKVSIENLNQAKLVARTQRQKNLIKLNAKMKQNGTVKREKLKDFFQCPADLTEKQFEEACRHADRTYLREVDYKR